MGGDAAGSGVLHIADIRWFGERLKRFIECFGCFVSCRIFVSAGCIFSRKLGNFILKKTLINSLKSAAKSLVLVGGGAFIPHVNAITIPKSPDIGVSQGETNLFAFFEAVLAAGTSSFGAAIAIIMILGAACLIVMAIYKLVTGTGKMIDLWIALGSGVVGVTSVFWLVAEAQNYIK